jgi:hypothetical protein
MNTSACMMIYHCQFLKQNTCGNNPTISGNKFNYMWQSIQLQVVINPTTSGNEFNFKLQVVINTTTNVNK